SYADNQFNCPTTFQTVSVGATMDEVQAACGQPASTSTSTAQVNEPVNLIQWIYLPTNAIAQPNSQFMPQLVITFKDNQVVNVTPHNQTSTTNFPCLQNNRITVGSSMNFVTEQCGAPKYINKIQQSNMRNATVTQWVYNFGSYRPQMIFIFTDGKLTQIN